MINTIFKSLLLFIVLTVSYANDAVKTKKLYLDYTEYPKRVFTGQKFDIILKATVLKNKSEYDQIVLTYIDHKNIQIITREPKFVEDNENIFLSKLTFKTYNKEFLLPTITVALLKNMQIVEHLTIKPPQIRYEQIAVNQELFSGIIAKDLEVLTVKTKQYDNNTLHTTINIKAKNSNLEDIKLSKYKDQGIKSLTSNYPEQNLFFYVMTPFHVKELSFTYYNTNEKNFTPINIPINLEEDLVSTQTELNPYNSNMLKYKQYVSIFFLLLFIIIFAISRDSFYLFFIVILIGIVTYLFIPNKKIILKEDTKVYILPTKSSTIFKILDNKELVEIVNEKNNYLKVLFKNDNIGWVKSNDTK